MSDRNLGHTKECDAKNSLNDMKELVNAKTMPLRYDDSPALAYHHKDLSLPVL